MADAKPHPPHQARHPGRPHPAVDAERRAHEKAMRRPNEALPLASHSLGGRRPVPKPEDDPPQGE
jgi:hypothetical protein